MLDDPHYPSPKSVLGFFIVIVFLMVGVFAWAFYFNFGTISFSASQIFSVQVNGKNILCTTSPCLLSLPPNTYRFVASSEGFYDQSDELTVSRWKETTTVLSFEKIPFLQPFSSPLPDYKPEGFFEQRGSVKHLVVRQKPIATFESLQNPTVQVQGDWALIIDPPRAFQVNLIDGRKLRRFDDSIEVKAALLSDQGKTMLFDVIMKGASVLLFFDQDSSQVTTLSWYEPISQIVFAKGQDSRIIVISKTLRDSKKPSILEEVVTSTNGSENLLGLFQVSLQSEEIRQITLFSGAVPRSLMRRGERVFVIYEQETIDELINN